MASFDAVTNLGSLNGLTGFRLDGAAEFDSIGSSVSSAGDVNGDGFDDVIIGVSFADPNGDQSGSSYVVFGNAGGFPSVIDLASLNGTNGFRLDGETAGEGSGGSVSSAGDINGDGFDDLIIGAGTREIAGELTGASYIVFGSATAFGATVNLSTLNGTNGFRIDGAADGDLLGNSVSSAGDVNGDGLDDIIVGAFWADSNALNSGSAYVVYGTASGQAAVMNVSSLNGTNGFQLDGTAARDQSGFSVSSAGDVNGDGLDDLLVSANAADPNGTTSGSTYVVFARPAGHPAVFDLADLDGTNGFRLDGESVRDQSGRSVSSAGDVNGDGFDDLIIGAPDINPGGFESGAAYVVFGMASGFAPIVALSSLDGTNGFQINSAASFDRTGISVSSAGDVNGDGFDDVLVGANRTGNNGEDSGSSYVIFGRATGHTPTFNLSSLDGVNGFRLDGAAVDDLSGTSVSSAGDVNGDGFDDIVIGAIGADPNGNRSGSSYVFFGRAPDAAVERFGSAADQAIRGGAFDDLLAGLGGDDELSGGGGTDLLIGGSGADIHDGGAGFDTAFYGNSAAVTVNLTTNTGTGGEAQGDTFLDVENIRGSNFNDFLTGDALANALIGQDGNDVLQGMAAGDALLGGAGVDTASYASSNDTVAVNIGNGTGAGAHAAGDVLVGIENLTGSEFGDLLRGGSATANNSDTDNLLIGLGGGDLMLGDEGNDRLFGGAGGDVMTGGSGNDSFIFDNLSSEQDIIIDFDQNGDDRLTFTGFGTGFDFSSIQIFNVNDMTNDGIDNGDAFIIANGWVGGVVLKDAFTLVDAGDFVFV